ncbi:hypothetical protein DSBG_0320 [Desulfosporosinus sp. BG]|nr:hypothetical protein DSBG_0320 [Desulfosporosinus sp. BG]
MQPICSLNVPIISAKISLASPQVSHRMFTTNLIIGLLFILEFE